MLHKNKQGKVNYTVSAYTLEDADLLVNDLLNALSNTENLIEREPRYQVGYLSSLLANVISKNPGSEDILITRIKTIKERAEVTETA
jgi:hypothetical protein